MAIEDELSSRITTSCPEDSRQILLHAWSHDVTELKRILDSRERANVQDPSTGETPLHAAIRACGPSNKSNGTKDLREEPTEEPAEEEDGIVAEAKETLEELFMSGAIWNDVDNNNETPGCVALRLGRDSLYNMCVEAGVRAELLFALMDGYEELSSGSGEEAEAEDDGVQQNATGAVESEENRAETDLKAAVPGNDNTNTVAEDKPVTSKEYLQSDLTYDNDKLVDSDLNGVMMSWETDIMKRSVSALIPDSASGKRILNIGFGMGIIDGMFADLKPAKHHIIEAHPAVLDHIAKPDSRFGSAWEQSGPQDGAYKVWKGRWQEVVPQLFEQGELYDAIYFDTFGEDYAQLRMFFMEYVPGLMDFEGRFSFFNGLGADRKICYDVYTRVVDMHGSDAGLDVEWEEIDVDMSDLSREGEGEWEGVRRRYWTLDKYRLPICTFMG